MSKKKPYSKPSLTEINLDAIGVQISGDTSSMIFHDMENVRPSLIVRNQDGIAFRTSNTAEFTKLSEDQVEILRLFISQSPLEE